MILFATGFGKRVHFWIRNNENDLSKDQEMLVICGPQLILTFSFINNLDFYSGIGKGRAAGHAMVPKGSRRICLWLSRYEGKHTLDCTCAFGGEL